MKKFLSTVMLLIFFAGQVNLAWAEHFCGDKLVESAITLIPATQSCCDSDVKSPMDCCEDQVAQSDADDFFKKAEANASISPEFVLAYVITFLAPIQAEVAISTFTSISDDIPIPDLLVLHQTFLI